MNYLNLFFKTTFFSVLFYFFNINSMDNNNDEIIKNLINSQNSLLTRKKSSKYSCLKKCLPFTVSHLFVMLLTLGVCYYAYTQLLLGCGQIEKGCDNMQNACNNCISDLSNAKSSIVGFQNFTNTLMKILKNCPTGKLDILEGFYKLENDCCKK